MNTVQALFPGVKGETEFEVFWDAYPRRQKKGDAAKAWFQTRKERPNIREILAAVDRARFCPQWAKDGGEFIPLPATWLRAWGWADEYDAPEVHFCEWAGCGKPSGGQYCEAHIAAKRRGETPVRR